MNKFNIGDRVKIKTFGELPEHMKKPGISKLAGKGAVIEDRIYSEARDAYTYVLTIDGYDAVSSVQFPEESIQSTEPVSYIHEIEYLDNIVIAHFYEVRDGVKTELKRGHGHIIHDDAYGVAQAAAFALTRIAKELKWWRVEKEGRGMKQFFKDLWLSLKLLFDGFKYIGILRKEGKDDV